MNNIWSDLIFSSGRSAQSILGGVGYSWLNGNGPLGDIKFKSKPASKVVTARVAQQIAMQMAEGEVNKLFPRLQRQLERALRDKVLKETKDNEYATLIKNGRVASDNYGSITTSDSGDTIVARDYLSRKVPEALILSYNDAQLTENIIYTFPKAVKTDVYRIKEQSILKKLIESAHTIEHDFEHETEEDITVETKDVIHIDLSAQVSLSTNKNLVLTPVQGRACYTSNVPSAAVGPQFKMINYWERSPANWQSMNIPLKNPMFPPAR